MGVIRVRERFTPYAQIDKAILNNKNLSWKAKGLIAYLLSKPDNWQVMIADLVNMATDGRDGVRAAIIELEKAGHLVKQKSRSGAGKFAGWDYEVFEIPTENGKTDVGKTENGKTDVGKSATTNKEDSNKELNNNDLSNTAEAGLLENSEALKAKEKKENSTLGPGEILDQIRGYQNLLISNMLTPVAKKDLAKKIAALKASLPVEYPFESGEFLEAWADWERHKRKTRKWYTTPAGEQNALLKLVELSGAVEFRAIQLIQQAIYNSWQTFYPLKDNGNQQQPTNQNRHQRTNDPEAAAAFAANFI